MIMSQTVTWSERYGFGQVGNIGDGSEVYQVYYLLRLYEDV